MLPKANDEAGKLNPADRSTLEMLIVNEESLESNIAKLSVVFT